MNKAHQKSSLPLQDMIQTADDNTVELFHFDISPNGALNNTKPVGEDMIDDSCIMCLDMDNLNPDGTYVVDKSRYGNHGKLYGVTIGNGMNGKALSFDGTIADYILLPNSILKNTSDFTITLRVNSSNLSKAINTIFHATIGGGNDLSCEFYSDRIVIVMFSSNVYTFTTASVTNTWYHIVMRRAGDKCTIIKDGVLLPEQTCVTAIINITGAIVLGQEQDDVGTAFDANQAFVGTMQDVRVYSRALSATEIAGLYNKSIYSLRPDSKYGGTVAVEEATTNLLLNPSDMTNAVWNSNVFDNWITVTRTANTDIAPDGTKTATKLTSNSSNTIASDIGQRITCAVSTVYTFSVWMKNIDNDVNTCLQFATGLNGGLVSYQLSNAIYNLTSEWKRYSITYTTPASGINQLEVNIYNITNTKSILVWGAQLEQKSFSTSFVDGSRVDGQLIYPTSLIGDFTISFWAASLWDSSISLAKDRPMIGLSNGTNALHFFYGYGGDTYVGDETSYVRWPISATVFTKYQFIYFSLVRSSTTLYVYKDGKLTDTVALGSTTNYTKLKVGRYAPSAYIANILIDELRIDNVARTSDEILSFYLSGCPFWPKGPEKVVL